MSATAMARASAAACTSALQRRLVAEVLRQLALERRLLLHRFEFADVEIVALLGQRGDLVHQRLGLTRAITVLSWRFNRSRWAGDLRTPPLVALDLRFERGDPRPDARLALLPQTETLGLLRQCSTQRGSFPHDPQLVGQRVDPLQFDELGMAGWPSAPSVAGRAAVRRADHPGHSIVGSGAKDRDRRGRWWSDPFHDHDRCGGNRFPGCRRVDRRGRRHRVHGGLRRVAESRHRRRAARWPPAAFGSTGGGATTVTAQSSPGRNSRAFGLGPAAADPASPPPAGGMGRIHERLPDRRPGTCHPARSRRRRPRTRGRSSIGGVARRGRRPRPRWTAAGWSRRTRRWCCPVLRAGLAERRATAGERVGRRRAPRSGRPSGCRSWSAPPPDRAPATPGSRWV